MSAHLGNWEVGLQKFKLEFSPFYVVAREIKSRWAASIMKKLRTRYGVEIIQAKNSYRTIVDLLKQNKVVGFAFYQHHGHRGIYVDFFGRAAATSPGIAMLARETGASLSSVKSWQHMAELASVRDIGPQYAELLERSGINSIGQLRRYNPTKLLKLVRKKQDSLKLNIQGNSPGHATVEHWIDEANDHKYSTT